MTTPATEPLRALTTAGHQSLIEPSAPVSLDVDDAGFRMLEPHEIQLGMGFAADYHLVGSMRTRSNRPGTRSRHPPRAISGTPSPSVPSRCSRDLLSRAVKPGPTRRAGPA